MKEIGIVIMILGLFLMLNNIKNDMNKQLDKVNCIMIEKGYSNSQETIKYNTWCKGLISDNN